MMHWIISVGWQWHGIIIIIVVVFHIAFTLPSIGISTIFLISSEIDVLLFSILRRHNYRRRSRLYHFTITITILPPLALPLLTTIHHLLTHHRIKRPPRRRNTSRIQQCFHPQLYLILFGGREGGCGGVGFVAGYCSAEGSFYVYLGGDVVGGVVVQLQVLLLLSSLFRYRW